jgi:hypothetical protein
MESRRAGLAGKSPVLVGEIREKAAATGSAVSATRSTNRLRYEERDVEDGE